MDAPPRGVPKPGIDPIHVRADERTDQEPDEDISWLSVLVAILRHPRILVGAPIIGLLAFTAWARLNPDSYEAESKFLTQGSSSAASGLAAAFGFGGGESGEGVGFYQALLDSRQLLKEAALTEYRFAVDDELGDSIIGNVLEVFEMGPVNEPVDADQLLGAVSLLRNMINVGIDGRSGMVILVTITPWPEFSELLNRRLLELTNTFNLERRQSQAAAERRFVEGRLRVRGAELKAAEDELEQFLDRNRSIESSPQLQFQRARIQRRVTLADQVFTTLSQAYEQARIDEVRNTPVVTIVDPPEGSVQAQNAFSRLGRIGFILGLVAGVMLALVVELLSNLRRQNAPEFREAEDLLRAAPATLLPRFWMGKRA